MITLEKVVQLRIVATTLAGKLIADNINAYKFDERYTAEEKLLVHEMVNGIALDILADSKKLVAKYEEDKLAGTWRILEKDRERVR